MTSVFFLFSKIIEKNSKDIFYTFSVLISITFIMEMISLIYIFDKLVILDHILAEMMDVYLESKHITINYF